MPRTGARGSLPHHLPQATVADHPPRGVRFYLPPPRAACTFFEGSEIFLEPLDMLLDFADGRSEFCHRAECSTHARHLRLGRALTHRPAHEPKDEHPAK